MSKYTDLQVHRLMAAIEGSKLNSFLTELMFKVWRYGERRAGFNDPEDPRLPTSDESEWPLDARVAMRVGNLLDRASVQELNLRAHLRLDRAEKQHVQQKRESQTDHTF